MKFLRYWLHPGGSKVVAYLVAFFGGTYSTAPKFLDLPYSTVFGAIILLQEGQNLVKRSRHGILCMLLRPWQAWVKMRVAAGSHFCGTRNIWWTSAMSCKAGNRRFVRLSPFFTWPGGSLSFIFRCRRTILSMFLQKMLKIVTCIKCILELWQHSRHFVHAGCLSLWRVAHFNFARATFFSLVPSTTILLEFQRGLGTVWRSWPRSSRGVPVRRSCGDPGEILQEVLAWRSWRPPCIWSACAKALVGCS